MLRMVYNNVSCYNTKQKRILIMELQILGSGSLGNCYILKPKTGKSLIIDCGVNFTAVKKALDFDYISVAGALCTHRHNDHAEFINEFMRVGIETFALLDVFQKTGFSVKSPNQNEIKALKSFIVGDFKIMAFDLKHDVPCLGFQIDHPESGRIIFITDTNFCEYTFDNVNQFIVEANFSHEILESKFKEKTKMQFLHDRILRNHFSLRDCKNLLRANDLKNVVNIVLIHLSDSNSNEKQFIREVFELTGKTTTAASAGMKIDFNLNPF